MAQAGPTGSREPCFPGVADDYDDYTGSVVSRVFTCLLNGKFGAIKIQIAVPHTPQD